MDLLHLSFANPARNLALDELLLNEAEAGRTGEVLRFWESPVPFVVLGLTQSASAHVEIERCDRDRVPILRRCSAGGCVLQGPGCLNFALVARIDRPGYGTISASYRTILGALAPVFSEWTPGVAHRGISDLAVRDRKFSGNAQRRRRRFLLHHGTLLYAADLTAYTEYLKQPTDQPEYRAGRAHTDFTVNLQADRSLIVRSVSHAFRAANPLSLTRRQLKELERLTEEKYKQAPWTYKIP